ncbi:MAG: GAF domain-containing sensor histidine kinase [Acidobacteria bacterium]|nr:GAF domain-containing sensor histidine kinase [Acidobacteriota bacterium]MBI3426231.1 GAF domain-containing sensor histidine kinase [Acidobacteriota bacterium]
MTPFLYRKIGQPLLDELYEKVVIAHESVVLIAPRYGGKRYLMRRLYELLQTQEELHLLRLESSLRKPISNEKEFYDWLSKAVREADNRFTECVNTTEDPFAPLDWLITQSQRPVVLLVSNVDSLPQYLARNLLLKVRTLVEEKKLMVALSGEDVFQKLVHGPTSEFNCAYQYFLQGFDKEFFAAETLRYRDELQLCFANDEEAVDCLYELAGGYLSILKTLLRDVSKARVNANLPLDTPIAVSDIPRAISPDLLRQPPRVINNAPECWEDLKQLLRDDVVWVNTITNAPGPLELAGVARREGWRMRLASPLLKTYLKTYYNNKRFGDLYLRNDKSEAAFAYYEHLAEEERVRPANADDRREVAFNIKTLSAALHVAAAKGTSAVGKLLHNTCRYVLGFREVACLELNGEWKMLSIPGCQLKGETIKELNHLLPHEPKPGRFPLTGRLKQYVFVAIVPAPRSGQFRAVVISDFAANRIVSRERELLVNQLFEHFVMAYTQAAEIEAARLHLQTRDRHIEIANSIFDGLGKYTRDVEHVIRIAAQALRKLGYSRVSFCLVDPEQKRITGVLDDSDSPDVDVAKMTDWPLDDPKADVQSYVINTRKPIRILDATREPLVNPEVVKKARLKAFAVVPLLDLAEEAIGTVHVEREDGFAPTEDEVEDLLQLGRQLAIALELSERVNLLQSALDKIMSSLVIVDSSLKLRFANQVAATLLGVEKGWQNQPEAKLLTETDVGTEAMKMVEMSLQGHRQERHIKLKEKDDRHGWEALSEVIQGRSNQIVGAFLRIRDLDYVYRMFEAFNTIAEATDKASALKLLLTAARKLGFERGRLYLVDPDNPNCLVSADSFGFADTQLEERFNRGEIRTIRMHFPGKECWKCLDEQAPKVFFFAPEKVDSNEYITQKGQVAIVVSKPRLETELKKKSGDAWLDIPLLTQDKHPLGKLTLDWKEDRWPREFDLLEVLVEMVARVLDTFQQRERIEEQMNLVRTQAAQQVMATMAHNIGTQLAALPILLTRYKQREKDLPGLHKLDHSFGKIIEETTTIIKRAKERLAVVSPQIKRLDLAACLDTTLQSYLPEQNCEVICRQRPFQVEADSHLLKIALFELVENSKDAVGGEMGNLQVKITLEIEPAFEGNQVKIIYRDNGPGVPEDFKERIFEDFFSRHPGRAPGTGLGMGYVRRVVEAHGGKIKECGKPNEGAEFIITLPLARAVQPTEE